MLMLIWLACADQKAAYQGPTGEGIDIFCDEFSEAGDTNELPFNSASSGRLEAQLIIEGDDPKDRSIIGNATYMLKPPQGGGESLNQADALGFLSKTLGAGQWEIRVEGADECSNEVTVDIEAGVLLEMCLALYCPET